MNYRNIVVTLYEGHYQYGVAALLNSLHAAGFEGLFCVGYKGSLPNWLDQLKHIESNTYQFTEKIDVRFDAFEIDMHFGYYKPYYLKQMAETYPGGSGWFYFDPDIIVIGKWEFYESWIQSGVALCQDSNYSILYWNHPWRNQWRNDFDIYNKGIDKTLNYYINSGFIGVSEKDFEIINRWIGINEIYKSLGYPVLYFNQSDALNAYKGDQDVLNAAITLSPDLRLAIIGKEGMAFEHPYAIMAHAVDGKGVKPWKRKYIKNALKGNKASITDELYLQYCINPIRLYHENEMKKRRISLLFSKIINRLWKK